MILINRIRLLLWKHLPKKGLYKGYEWRLISTEKEEIYTSFKISFYREGRLHTIREIVTTTEDYLNNPNEVEDMAKELIDYGGGFYMGE